MYFLGKINITFYGMLRKTIGEKNICIEASTVKDAINILISRYGDDFSNFLYDENGKIRRFLNIYVNGRDIRFLDNLNTKLNDDEISFIAAVGGG